MAKQLTRIDTTVSPEAIKRSSEIKGELVRLENQHGILTPQIVLDSARSELSPLHNNFDWNDDNAAEKYRLMQARMLLTSVKIEIGGQEERAYMNVYIQVANTQTRAYISTEKVMANPDLHKQVIAYAARELAYWKEKYDTYVELQGVVNDDKLQELMEEVEP